MTPATNSTSCCTPITDGTIDLDTAGDMALRFKALGDPARVRLVNLIASNREMCVCELTEPLGLSQPTVSHHLKVLVSAGLIEREQRGKWAYFTINEGELGHLAHALLNETQPVATPADDALSVA
jgi:ArsR family transcriptional regulator